MYDTIELTETARLVVEQDQYAENPRKDFDMMTGFVKIEGRGDSRIIDVEPVHEPPVPVYDAYRQFYGSGPSHFTDVMWRRHKQAVDLTQRWARLFHRLHVEYDYEHGGFWFVDPSAFQQNFPVDPNTGLVACFKQVAPAQYEESRRDPLEVQAEIIGQEQETYRKWAEGEICVVALERQVTHATYRVQRSITGFDVDLTEEPRITDDWEMVDSLSGCYLDDDYTAQVVASEHFDLTPEETEALGLPEKNGA